MKLLIIDDHAIVREGLKQLLSSKFDEILTAENGEVGIEILSNLNRLPDIILLDIMMPVMNGLETMKVVATQYAQIPVVVLTTVLKSEKIEQMLKLGAKGFILKDSEIEVIQSAIDQAIAGQLTVSPEAQKQLFSVKEDYISLSEREKEVLSYVMKGLKNKEIGELLFISERTVRSELTSIYQKFSVENRAEAVGFAIHHDII